jgi:ribonuclease P protein component
VLPKAERVRASGDFRDIMRTGAKAVRPGLVVHLRRRGAPPSRAGFVVSKAVGNAVTRNLVKRRLRHLSVGLLRESPFPVDMVVRARPGASAVELGPQLRSAFQAGCARLGDS